MAKGAPEARDPEADCEEGPRSPGAEGAPGRVCAGQEQQTKRPRAGISRRGLTDVRKLQYMSNDNWGEAPLMIKPA
jgi:hypothetical protein